MVCEEHGMIAERVTRVEESAKSAHKRIDNVESIQKNIQELTVSVSSLAGSVKRLVEDMTEVKTRVSCIEGKPGKRWDIIISSILTSLVGGIIGFVIAFFAK